MASQFVLDFADDQQVQNSESGMFANSQNILITGGTFVSSRHRLCTNNLTTNYLVSDQCPLF